MWKGVRGMNPKYWPIILLVIVLSLGVTACQPKMKSARAPSEGVNVPETLDLQPAGLKPTGDSRHFENAKALLTVLGGTQEIEPHILIRDGDTPAEQQARQQLWTELPQDHKNVATQILSQCQVIKKQTRPDLSTLSPTAQFSYGSDLHTEGPQCPAVLSRISTSQGKVIEWKRDSKTGSYRTTTSVKTVSEFQNPEHQQILGIIKGEFTMNYVLDALRLGEGQRRTFLQATGTGYLLLTNKDTGRIDLKYRGQELHKDGIKRTAIYLDATVSGQTYSYAFFTEGTGLQRSLRKAYIGKTELSADDIQKLKVEKLATKLSLSIN